MPNPFLLTGRKTKHLRLWPLLILPLLGLVAGLSLANSPRRLTFGCGVLDSMPSGVLGFLAGSGAMVISAFVVLAYRVARRRFTIGNILVTIAFIAVLMGIARGLLS